MKTNPSIFLDGVKNIAALKQAIDGIAKNQYVIKIVRDNQVNQVKIQSLTTAKYYPIMEALK